MIVPPFAEEMNKCRRMMGMFAQALSSAGIAAAYVDLFGTGDSDGEFERATWERWNADVRTALAWCERRGLTVTGILGIRLGCALAAAASAVSPGQVRTVAYWQPVADGARALEQFLRVRTVASVMEDDRRESVKELRERLRGGETLEVAGYALSPQLAADLAEVVPAALRAAPPIAVHWMDVVREARPAPSASIVADIETLRNTGSDVVYHQIVGEPFWSSTEIVCLPRLVAATVQIFDGSP